MITIEEFTEKLAEAFGIEEKGKLLPDTHYKDLEEWDSMRALLLIAFVDSEFNVLMTGEDLKQVNTVREVYQLVKKSKE